MQPASVKHQPQDKTRLSAPIITSRHHNHNSSCYPETAAENRTVSVSFVMVTTECPQIVTTSPNLRYGDFSLDLAVCHYNLMMRTPICQKCPIHCMGDSTPRHHFPIDMDFETGAGAVDRKQTI